MGEMAKQDQEERERQKTIEEEACSNLRSEITGLSNQLTDEQRSGIDVQLASQNLSRSNLEKIKSNLETAIREAITSAQQADQADQQRKIQEAQAQKEIEQAAAQTEEDKKTQDAAAEGKSKVVTSVPKEIADKNAVVDEIAQNFTDIDQDNLSEANKQKIKELMGRFEQLKSSENKDALEQLLAEVKELTDELKKQSEGGWFSQLTSAARKHWKYIAGGVGTIGLAGYFLTSSSKVHADSAKNVTKKDTFVGRATETISEMDSSTKTFLAIGVLFLGAFTVPKIISWIKSWFAEEEEQVKTTSRAIVRKLKFTDESGKINWVFIIIGIVVLLIVFAGICVSNNRQPNIIIAKKRRDTMAEVEAGLAYRHKGQPSGRISRLGPPGISGLGPPGISRLGPPGMSRLGPPRSSGTFSVYSGSGRSVSRSAYTATGRTLMSRTPNSMLKSMDSRRPSGFSGFWPGQRP